MACFYFRLKTDKKPNGMRISSASHVSYVNREGRFRNIDNVQEMGANKSYKNFLSGDHPIMKLPEKPMLLYSSPFGKIKLDAMGVHVSHHASIETTAIALSVAQKIFGDEVAVQGSAKFEEQLLAASRDLKLGAHFANVDMEIQNTHNMEEREQIEFGRRLAEGSALCARRRDAGRRSDAGDDRSSGRSADESRAFVRSRNEKRDIAKIAELAAAPVADIAEHTKRALAPGLHLHVLPAGNVAGKGQRASMLLPRNVGAKLLDERRGRDSNLDLRWSFSPKRKEAVTKAADSILQILQKNETGDFAFSHLQYINREAAYEQRGGCSMTGHHLPKWADDSPLRFFHAADRFERANGERYKEIVFSLPNELPVEKSKEILDRFIEKHLKNHYYAWAIHEKVGAMSAGERHPHVHLMFSTREIDDVERSEERAPEVFFKRANAKEPEKGGCKKAAKWNDAKRADYLFDLREDFARIQNDVLEKHRIPSRVSHLCLEAQKMHAEMRGDYVLAEILERLPERPTDPISIIRDDDVVRQQKQLRSFNDKRLDAIMRRVLFSDAKKERETTHIIERTEKLANLLRDEEFVEFDEATQKELAALQQAMTEQRRDLHLVEAKVVWGREALEEARLDYLGEDGREAWERTMNLRRDLHEQKEFWYSLDKPEDASLDEEVALTELELALEERIGILTKEYKEAARKLQPHLKKLAARATNKSIQYRLNHLLFQNKMEKQRYIRQAKDFEKTTLKFKRRLEEARARRFQAAEADGLREDLSMTLDEVKKLVQVARYYQTNAIRAKTRELEEAKKKVLSNERIIKIAENIFEKGGWKRLRESERDYKKKEALFEKDLAHFMARKEDFKKRPEEDSHAYRHEKEELLAELRDLNKRREALVKWRDENQAKREAMEKRRDTPKAEYKIQQIALSILKKNRPAAEKAKKIAAELKSLRQEFEKMRGETDGVEQEMMKRGNGRYKVVQRSTKASGGGGGNGTPSRIEKARTVAQELLAMQHGALIARAKEDKTLTENWNLVSSFDKDEIIEEESRGR